MPSSQQARQVSKKIRSRHFHQALAEVAEVGRQQVDEVAGFEHGEPACSARNLFSPNKKAPGCPGARSLSASYLLFHFQTNRDFVDFALPCCLHRRRLVFASQLIGKWN
jgi:hypothetical protein